MTSLLKALIFTCAISMAVGATIDVAKKSELGCTEPQRLACLKKCTVVSDGHRALDCPEDADCMECYLDEKKEMEAIGEKVKAFKSMDRRILSKDDTKIQERRRAITEAFDQAEKEGASSEDMLKRVKEILQKRGGIRISISW